MSSEFNGEWVIGSNIPFVDGVSIEVQTMTNEVRKVCRKPSVDFGSLWFTDCTHPSQNAYCSENMIKAWRVSKTSTITLDKDKKPLENIGRA